MGYAILGIPSAFYFRDKMGRAKNKITALIQGGA
jgi:hypothetical protein